jgi:DNA-binding MarR family transcriptional regulator
VESRRTAGWQIRCNLSGDPMNYRNSANVVSLRCDTVPSNRESTVMSGPIIAEVEITTTASRDRALRMSGRFLKGPIAMPAISQASRLGGRALAVYLAIHHQTALTKKHTVTLPRALLNDLGVDKDAKARALKSLEATGLICTECHRGRSVRVSLAEPLSTAEPGARHTRN